MQKNNKFNKNFIESKIDFSKTTISDLYKTYTCDFCHKEFSTLMSYKDDDIIYCGAKCAFHIK